MTEPKEPLNTWGLSLLHQYPDRQAAALVTDLTVYTTPNYGGHEQHLGVELNLTLGYLDAEGRRAGWTVTGEDAVTQLNDLIKAAGWAP